MDATPNSNRVLELDGLRALAVLAVISFHYTLDSPLLHRVAGFGWVGVDLFFVLSGFLITRILLAARSRPRYFSTFYARRALRIFPVYYLLLLAYVLSARVAGGPQPWAYWGMHLTFLSSTVEFFRSWNFAAPAAVYAGVTVLWSLSIEEQFYLLWAPVVKWLRPTGLWIVLAMVVTGAPLLRHAAHTRVSLEYRFLPARFDSLAWGALLALGWARWSCDLTRLRRWLTGLGLGAGLGLAALVVLTGGARSSLDFATWGYTALAAGFAAVIGRTVARAGSASLLCRWLRLRPLRHLGQISYTVYLVHYPILLLVGGWLKAGWGGGTEGLLVRDLLSLAATIAVASVSWHFLESPLLRFKDGWTRPARAKLTEPRLGGVRTPQVAGTAKWI